MAEKILDDIHIYLKQRKKLIDSVLHKYLSFDSRYVPASLFKAMNYSVFPGGKRFRPILTLLATELCGGNIKKVLPAACAVELIHSYSLIQDDLPSMDNDDYRRGKLSCHKKFGEATAILCSDALLSLAFEILASNYDSYIIKEVAEYIGYKGLIRGQALDLQFGKASRNSYILEKIYLKKTASLIVAALRIGALISKASQKQINALTRYGKKLGIAYQIVDDMKDSEGRLYNKKVALLRLKKIRKNIEKESVVFPKDRGLLTGFFDYLILSK